MKKDYKKMRKDDEHLVSLVYRPLTEKIAILLFKTPITPTMINHLGLISAILSGLFFSYGTYGNLIIAAIFVQLTIIFDLLDGQVARYKGMRTMFGRWYDKFLAKLTKYIMFLGATVGVYNISKDPRILIVGTIAIVNIITISFIINLRIFYDFVRERRELPRTGRFFLPFGMLTTTLLTIAALTNEVKLLLWFYAIFGTLGWMKQVYTHYKYGRYVKIK